VLGPIRLPYQRAVSVVRYVSHLLDELMGQFHSGR
jgi:transcriptional regulator of heat shock response